MSPNGHNSRTCSGESSPAAAEIVLFGVRVKVDPMRKSVSLNNLCQYEQPNANNESSKVADEGYASADDAVPNNSGSGRERKRGVPWTEEEHKLFLLGLQKVGKGDWRGISRNFVKTRTPTQVASHAQKYFLRRSNLNRRRRRSSLFDITTDSVSVIPTEERKDMQETPVLPSVETSKVNAFPVAPFPFTVGPPLVLPPEFQKPIEGPIFGVGDQINNASSVFLRPVPVVPLSNSSRMTDLNFNQNSAMEASSLSLRLSLSLDHSQLSSSTSHSAFQVMPSFNNGENVISVA